MMNIEDMKKLIKNEQNNENQWLWCYWSNFFFISFIYIYSIQMNMNNYSYCYMKCSRCCEYIFKLFEWCWMMSMWDISVRLFRFVFRCFCRIFFDVFVLCDIKHLICWQEKNIFQKFFFYKVKINNPLPT